MTGNVQLYLTRARAMGAVPWMEAHLVGFGRGVKGLEAKALEEGIDAATRFG